MSLLMQYLDWVGAPDAAPAPKLAELLSVPLLADALVPRLGTEPVVGVTDIDDDDTRDIVLMTHADDSVTLFMAPAGDLDVPEFITCMAELRRRAGNIVHRSGCRVRAALVTHDRTSYARAVAVMSACNQYGVFFMPLPNLIERL